MSEFLVTLLSGGVAGASVAAVIAKFLIQNQLSKSLKDYQHQLDIKKNSIQTELSIYADNEKQKTLDFGRKRIEALEAVYAQVVLTSLPRHGFVKYIRKLPPNTPIGDQISVYFDAFKDNYDAYKKAFDCISNAYKVLEEQAIYLDENLEAEVALALGHIHSYYSIQKREMSAPYDYSLQLFDIGKLESKDMNFDFSNFFDIQSHEWNQSMGPLRNHLKQRIRGLLTPDKPNECN